MMGFIQRLLCATLINLIFSFLFAVILFSGIKLKKADSWEIIKLKQLFVNFILSVYIWSVCPIVVAVVLWIILYILFKTVLFKKDRARLVAMYEEYELQAKPYPIPTKISQIRDHLNYHTSNNKGISECGYGFMFHSISILAVVVLYLMGVMVFTPYNINATWYIIDRIIVVTMVSIPIGKLTFDFSFYNLSCLSFGSVLWSAVNVVLVEAVYFIIVVGIMLNIILT